MLLSFETPLSAVASLKSRWQEHEIRRAQPRRQSELRSDLGDCASSHDECLAGSLVSRKMGSKCPVYIRERQAALTASILKIKKKEEEDFIFGTISEMQ